MRGLCGISACCDFQVMIFGYFPISLLCFSFIVFVCTYFFLFSTLLCFLLFKAEACPSLSSSPPLPPPLSLSRTRTHRHVTASKSRRQLVHKVSLRSQRFGQVSALLGRFSFCSSHVPAIEHSKTGLVGKNFVVLKYYRAQLFPSSCLSR